MTLTTFHGGLFTGVGPEFIQPNQASLLLDADIDRLSIKSSKLPYAIQQSSKSFYQFKEFNSEPQNYIITSGNAKRSYAELAGKLCFSDGGPVCKISNGTPLDDDIAYSTLGIGTVEGTILTEVLGLSDIVGASATINNGNVGDGYINEPEPTYRIVDGNNLVYTLNFKNSTGNATVSFILPADCKVFREVVTKDFKRTDRFLFVGQGSFTDGLAEFVEGYDFAKPKNVDNYSCPRMALLNSISYTVSYSTAVTAQGTEVNIESINKYSNSWTIQAINEKIISSSFDGKAEASLFTHGGDIFLMLSTSSDFKILKYMPLTASLIEVVGLGVPLDSEYCRTSTISLLGDTLFVLPKGKIGTFNGTTFIVRSMQSLPYAKVEDSLYATKGTDVYCLVNNRHEANIRKLDIATGTYSLVGNQRIGTGIIRGLGGTSGSNLVDGDFIIFPIHNGLVKFSTLTYQVVNTFNVGHRVSTNVKSKCFSFESGNVKSLYQDATSLLTSYGDWNSLDDGVPVWFDVPTLSGTYSYNVSQRTPDGLSDGPIMAVESSPIEVRKGHVKVDLTNITHTEPLRLYRTGGYLTVFTMVENIDPTTQYTDTRADVTVSLGVKGAVSYNTAPKEGTRWLTEHRGRLFGAVGNTLYWSKAGDPNSWDSLASFIEVDREITQLCSVGNGLLIFMDRRIKLLLGTLNSDFQLRTVSASRGTLDSWSVQQSRNGAMFFSDDGLCFTDGATIEDISYYPLGVQNFNVLDSATTDRYYYALLVDYTSSKKLESKVILRYDYAQNAFSMLSGENIDSLGLVDGILHHVSGGVLYKTEASGLRQFNYRTGNLNDQQDTAVKEFDRVRVSGKYYGNLKIYVDDKVVVDKDINIDTVISNLHIPKNNNKGRSISLEFLGYGEITGINYSLTVRRTTK